MIAYGAMAAALACAVCFGEPGAPMTRGAMAGVLVLAGFIIVVLAWITLVVRFMLRRARAAGAEEAPAHTPPGRPTAQEA